MGKSNQRGWIVLRGKKWYGYFRRTVLNPTNNQCKTDTIPVVLGLKSHMTKYQAREALEREITKQIGPDIGRKVMSDRSLTFRLLVRNRFFPLYAANW